jgi:predicted component of type VI protein secretion system
MIVLRLFKSADPTREIERRRLATGSLVIGRDPSADWVVDDPSKTLSRRHCTVSLTEGGAAVLDESTNGVALAGGERLPSGEPTAIEPGSTLILGAFLLRVDAGAVATTPPAPADPAQVGRLLDAFCAGAKIDPSVLTGEDPAEVMRRAGAVYRQMMLGLGALMTERTRTKVQLGLERTTVQAADNNPFRWAPPQRVAVDLLKANQDSFLSSEAAVRASFDDLMSHQAGLAGGSRAAVEEVLSKLSPETIAQALKTRSFLANRTGALWSEYVQVHEETREAAATPDGAAGAAFRQGYETAAADRAPADKGVLRARMTRPLPALKAG